MNSASDTDFLQELIMDEEGWLTAVAKLDNRRRITLPLAACEYLNLGENDFVEVKFRKIKKP